MLPDAVRGDSVPLGAMALYAAYGSNLDPRQMAERTPALAAARQRLAGRLAAHLRRRGHRLGGRPRHGRRGARAPRSSSCSTTSSAPDEAALDQWEGTDIGLYRKIRVRVHTLDGEVAAWLYVLDAYEGGLPAARYLGIIADAAEVAGAPDDYVADLRHRPCRSSGL